MKNAGWLVSTLTGAAALLSTTANAQELVSTNGYADQINASLSQACNEVADHSCFIDTIAVIDKVTEDYLSYADSQAIENEFEYCKRDLVLSSGNENSSIGNLRAPSMDAIVGCIYNIAASATQNNVTYEPEAMKILENHLSCLRGYDTQGRETCPVDRQLAPVFDPS